MPKVPVTAKQRASEFSQHGLYASDSTTLFCRHCNVTVSWDRKDSCEKHVGSEKHKKRLSSLQGSSSASERQSSISSAFQTAKNNVQKDKKLEFIKETAETFIKANIPLEKLDDPNIRAWLNKYIEGAGDMPLARTVREKYVGDIAKCRIEDAKTALKDKKIDILCDETTDKMGRCVFVVLFRILNLQQDKPEIFVAGVHFLEAANATNCVRAILDSLKMYNVQYGDVLSVVTDAARYMTKAVSTLEVILGDQLTHVQCWAHKLNLVGNVWVKELPELNNAMSKIKNVFNNTRKRRHLYASFLEEKHGEKRPLFPLPVVTRWNSWFNSVFYVADYIHDIVDFCKTDELKATQNSGVEFLCSLTENDISLILCQAVFVKEHAKSLVELIQKLEGSLYPTAHSLYGDLQGIKKKFENITRGIYFEATSRALSNMPPAKAAEAKVSITRTATQALSKLNSLMTTDPSRKRFEAIQIFSQESLLLAKLNPEMVQKLKTVHSLYSISTEELTAGFGQLQDIVTKQMETDNSVDVVKSLNVVKLSQPLFASSCLEAIWMPSANVDCERFLSSYNTVLTDRRTNLSEANLCIMATFAFES